MSKKINYEQIEIVNNIIQTHFHAESVMRQQFWNIATTALRALGGKLEFKGYLSAGVEFDAKWHPVQSVELFEDTNYEIYFRAADGDAMYDIECIDRFHTSLVGGETRYYKVNELLHFFNDLMTQKLEEQTAKIAKQDNGKN